MTGQNVRTAPSAARRGARASEMTRDTTPASALASQAKSVTLSIPGDPPSLNQAMSGRLRHRIREKTQWQQWTYAAWLEAGRPVFDRPEVRVRCYFATNRRRDAENYTCKHLVDALTRAGAWEDDNAGVYLQHRAELHIDRDNPRVELVITERSGA